MPRTTHTYAVLDVSRLAYQEIKARMEAAGSADAVHENHDGQVIDMHGVALKELPPQGQLTETESDDGERHSIEVASILSRRTKTGRVEITVGGGRVQLDVAKAREVASMLTQAIEAAISDELLYRFLTTQCDLEDAQASAALIDFREMRQGSRGTVFPS